MAVIDAATAAAAEGALIVNQVRDLPAQAGALAITDDASYHHVVEFLKGIKQLRASIAATFDEHIHRAYEAHRALCREKQTAEGTAVEAERIAKALLATYQRGAAAGPRARAGDGRGRAA